MARERIRVDFLDHACLTRLERQVSEPLRVTWELSEEEDYPIPDGEVPGGRRHQILARTRQDPSPMPAWISAGDVEDAAPYIENFGEPGPDDILEQSARWPTNDWLRVTPDAERLEIRDEIAQTGIELDASQMAEGVYQLLGYTYDPPLNVWSRAPGLIKVVGEDEVGPPAIFVELEGEPGLVRGGDELGLRACVDAAVGSHLKGYIGRPIGATGEYEWREVELRSSPLVSRGEVELSVVLPADIGGNPLEDYRVRVDIEDPDGARYRAYLSSPISVGEREPPPDAGDASGCLVASTRSPLFVVLAGLGFLRRRRRTVL